MDVLIVLYHSIMVYKYIYTVIYLFPRHSADLEKIKKTRYTAKTNGELCEACHWNNREDIMQRTCGTLRGQMTKMM